MEHKNKLKKELSLLEVFSIASGTMISSGIFILPGLAFTITGPAVFVSYLLAGILALTGTLSIVELSTAMPKAGGDYYFITRSLGPLVGTISGFLSWFALSLKSSFAIFGIALFLNQFMGLNFILAAICTTTFFILLNIAGVKIAGRFEVIFVIALFIIMFIYVFIGLPKVDITNFIPFTKGKGIVGILSTAGFVFVSFGGLLKVSSISEEIKNPKKNIPLGLIASIVSIIIVYTLLLIVTVGVSANKGLAGSNNPIANAAKIFMGQPGFVALLIAGMFAFITTANAGIMSASRYPMALSRDKLLPGFISRVNKKLKTPIFSILITGVFISASLFMPLDFLVKAASAVILMTYILANISVIILRESKIQNYKPSFKSPLYPWLHITGIVFFIILLIDIPGKAKIISLIGVGLGALLYFFYGRKKALKEFALLHLIARITDSEIKHHELENELREVLHQRDDVTHDDIDTIIKNAKYLDIKQRMNVDELFKKVAGELTDDLSMDEKTIYSLLVKRENESSTVITDFVAIPHIIIKGTDAFKLLVVRAAKGIEFSDENSDIKSIFVLMGTKDNRNFHLKALAAIAQIIQDKDFEKFWIKAKNENNIKDLLLLSERKRYKN